MSPEQLTKVLKELDARGASREEIETVYNAYKMQGQKAVTIGQINETAAKEVPGVFQGIVQSVAKPFLTAGTTIAAGVAAPIGRVAGYSQEQVNSALAKGADFGWFSDGNIKPIGSQIYQYENLSEQQKQIMGASGVAETAARTAATGAGTMAEMASYAIAPLKAAQGFWQGVKSGVPISAAFGVGTGLQKYGETGDAKEGAWQGTKDFVGSSIGFGLFNKAGQIFNHFGSRVLQSKAMRMSGQWLNDFTERVWQSYPEGFTKNAVTTIGERSKFTYDSLKKEFDLKWKTVSDNATEAVNPKIADPREVTFRFERNVAKALGDEYRGSNALYDNVKADQTMISGFATASASLDKMAVPELSGKMTAQELQKAQFAMAGRTEAGINFAQEMKIALQQPLTLKQIMEINARALEMQGQMSREESQYAREFAAGLFNDTKKQLIKQGDADLVKQWDNAYLSWERASSAYDSGLLGILKSSGHINNIVDKTIGKTLTREEERIIMNALKADPNGVQDLFISSVLEKARSAGTKEESAKIIRDFMDTWNHGAGKMMDGVPATERAELLASLRKGNGNQSTAQFLTPEQSLMLDDLATLYEGNFDEFYRGMRTVKGLNQEVAKDLYTAQGRVEVAKMIEQGRMDDIATAFTSLKDNPKFAKAVSVLPEEERHALGIAITKELYDSNTPFVAKLADGSYEVSKEASESFIKTWESIAGTDGIAGNRAIYELYSPEQIATIEQAYQVAKTTSSLGGSQGISKADFMPLVHGILAAGYFGYGFFAGGAHHAVNAMRGRSESSKVFYEAMNKLIEEGLVDSKIVTFGDIMTRAAESGGAQITSKALEEATTE